MEESIKNQMMYLVAWEMLKRLVSNGSVDIKILENLNKRNAESLMCDCLPIC